LIVVLSQPILRSERSGDPRGAPRAHPLGAGRGGRSVRRSPRRNIALGIVATTRAERRLD
jgi:hypothetical protein